MDARKSLLTLLTALVTGGAMHAAHSETFNFDTDTGGALPMGWQQGVTGRGNAAWSVQPDESAPSKPNVLRQSGVGAFPWVVRRGTSIADGYVEVKFKALEGREDQAGGVMWRWKDGDTYYVARANALENNVSLYYTEKAGGIRSSTSRRRCRPRYGIRCAWNSPASGSAW